MSQVAPPPVIKTNRHVFLAGGEAPGAPGLSSSRCRACRRFTLGRVAICSHCFARDLDVEAAGQQAELVEFSIARHPAGGFAAPYAIGLVRTTEGLTLFAPLQGEIEGLAAGRRLRFVTVDGEGGRTGFAYAPEPLAGEGQ